jgi:hypothetical protein
MLSTFPSSNLLVPHGSYSIIRKGELEKEREPFTYFKASKWEETKAPKQLFLLYNLP